MATATERATTWPARLPDELAERGLCASGRYPPETWFASSRDHEGREYAQWLCRSCPALAACRRYVESCDSELHGIWAAQAHGERERQRLARLRQQRGAA